MTLKLGPNTVSALRLGGTALTSLRLGTTLLWSATSIRDDFNIDDGPLDPALWSRDTAGFNFDIGVTNNTARVQIPDGPLDVTWGLQTSVYRFTKAQSQADDGYLEFQVATKGNPGYRTILYRRYVNNGTAKYGVGVALVDSILTLVYRANSTTSTTVKQLGSYSPGDVIRLVQTGNLHDVYRNGQFVGEWADDGAVAASGAGYRSIGMLMQGEKAILSPRVFSPAINYMEAS